MAWEKEQQKLRSSQHKLQSKSINPHMTSWWWRWGWWCGPFNHSNRAREKSPKGGGGVLKCPICCWLLILTTTNNNTIKSANDKCLFYIFEFNYAFTHTLIHSKKRVKERKVPKGPNAADAVLCVNWSFCII